MAPASGASLVDIVVLIAVGNVTAWARRYAFAALIIREGSAADLGTTRIALSATGLRSANPGLSDGMRPESP